jgi:hypothetical protein
MSDKKKTVQYRLTEYAPEQYFAEYKTGWFWRNLVRYHPECDIPITGSFEKCVETCLDHFRHYVHETRTVDVTDIVRERYAKEQKEKEE